jgi:Na+/H+ antiporter NhaD/arsenite permease-like protein
LALADRARPRPRALSEGLQAPDPEGPVGSLRRAGLERQRIEPCGLQPDPIGATGNLFFRGFFNLMLGIHREVSGESTQHEHRRSNNFTFGPIIEVAVLFAGIFVTMRPALLLLNARATGLALRDPWQFFWAAGALSSFLDNAPTYLTFAAVACGLHGVPLEGQYLAAFLGKGPATRELLSAIATGAVFMGANSYIGNGPNFMVKAIAEENGVARPSFFRYMAYSCGILLPLFLGVTLALFR